MYPGINTDELNKELEFFRNKQNEIHYDKWMPHPYDLVYEAKEEYKKCKPYAFDRFFTNLEVSNYITDTYSYSVKITPLLITSLSDAYLKMNPDRDIFINYGDCFYDRMWTMITMFVNVEIKTQNICHNFDEVLGVLQQSRPDMYPKDKKEAMINLIKFATDNVPMYAFDRYYFDTLLLKATTTQ
jgi:hypothetical protein